MFLAFDGLSQKKVILKMVKPNVHQAWLNQFRLEVQVLKRLNHPRIPTLIESHDDWDGCWLVEDYLEGLTLHDWLKTAPKKSLKQALFLELLELISCVHQAGFLYLDLKAENILVFQGHPYLIDFNACLPIGSVRPILINKDSLPPEGLAGQTMNEKADQIGLGKVYLLLFGPDALAWSALQEDPKDRFSDLEAFKKAIERSRSKRFRSLCLCFFGILAFLSLFTSSFLSVPALSNSKISQEEPIQENDEDGFHENPLSDVEKSSIPDFVQEASHFQAARLCQELQAQQEPLSAHVWLSYAFIAMDQNHRSLAGYLYTHFPSEIEEVRIYRSVLGLYLNKSLSPKELSWCLSALSEQENGLWFLEKLLLGLWQQEISLSPVDFQKIELILSQEKDVSTSLLEVLIHCLLMNNSQEIQFSSGLHQQFKAKIPELYTLYLRTQLSV